MVIVSEKNTEIYFQLEKNNLLPPSFASDSVIAFDLEDDFCIVFFSASKRSFLSFTAKDYLQITDSLPDLLNAVMEFSTEVFSPALFDKAIKYIENKMQSKNNFRFFFDAH
jgi:hypothetical protein